MRTRWATSRVAGYATLTVVGLVAALIIGRPEPAVLAAPFALFLTSGLLVAPATHGRAPVELALAEDRLVEGDTTSLTISAPAGSEVHAVLPTNVAVDDVSSGRGQVVLSLRPRRWGAYRVGAIAVREWDPLRLFVTETPVDARLVLRVHPAPWALRDAVAAAELQRRVGNHTSRWRGDGIEFADVRPFTTGDRARAVNWRASARRPPGELWVNDRRPERSADVVLMLDTFGDEERGRATRLDRAVRSLAAVAAAFHDQRDRIGFLTFGGQLRWIPPGLGARGLARVVDGLLDTEVLLTSNWEDVSRVPVGALPPQALLLAVTPLDNDTALHTLLDLRARGFDVAVVSLPVAEADAATDTARRLARLQRDARRLRLERLGIAVGIASGLDDLPLALREVEQWRRRARRVRT